MKNIFSVAAAVLLVFSSITYVACNKTEEPLPGPDLCAGVNCLNGGSCLDGACNCTAGYYGDSCEKKAIARYVGKWLVTQRVLESGDPTRKDATDTYEMQLSEDASGATVLKVDGLMGIATSSIKGRIRSKIGQVEVNNVITETEVPATINEFTFNRYQVLQGSEMQVLKGEGQIDGLGEKITGEFYITYPDDSLGAVQETIVFTADFIN